MPERIPGHSTRIRRAFDGINEDFVPYTGAIKDVDLGTRNFLTTGTVTGQLQMGQNLSPTYTTVQHWSDAMQSACIISGGTITDSGSGQVDVSAATGIIKITASDTGATVFFNYAGDTDFVLTNNDLNFLYLTYVDSDNAPTLAVTLNDGDINGQTEILIGWVHREGNIVHVLNAGARFDNNLARQWLHDHEVHGLERASGLIVTTDGSRNVLITAGVVYQFVNRLIFAAFNSSGADVFSTYHRASPSGWTETAGQSILNNTNYDDGDGTLGTLTSNRYGIHWVYAEHDGHVSIIYGQGDYKLAEAEDATPPTGIPSHILDMSILVAKIIIKESTSTTLISSAFDVPFAVSSVDDHNDLGGLQGGSADQYYHLTSAEYTALSGYVPYTGATALVDLGIYALTTTGSGTFSDIRADGGINVISDTEGIELGAGTDIRLYANAPGVLRVLARAGTNDLALHFETTDSNNGSITWKGVTQEFDFGAYGILAPSIKTASTTGVLSIQPDATGDGSDIDNDFDYYSGHGVKFFENANSDDENPVLSFYGYDKQVTIGQLYGSIGINEWGQMAFVGTARQVTFGMPMIVETTFLISSTVVGFFHSNTASGAGKKHIVFGGSNNAIDEPVWIFTDYSRRNLNFSVPDTTYPQLWIHDGSATAANALKLYHDGTDGILTTGAGHLKLNPTGNVYLKTLAGILKATAGAVSGSAVLNDLDNVNAGSPSDQDRILWDNGTSKWIPVTMPAFRAYLGSNQTVGTGAEDQVEIDTVTYDTGSGFNTGTFLYVIPETGYYTLGCLIAIQGTADAGKVFYVIIKKDSVDQLVVEKFVGTNVTNRYEAFIDLFCTAGEEIEFWTYHDMGVNKLVYGGVASTEIWGHRFK